jgi:HEAT repeat protein
MEFPKAKLTLSIASLLLLSSCSSHQAPMSTLDEQLFNQTLHSAQKSSEISSSDRDLAFYSSPGKNLNQALAEYTQIVRHSGVHDFDFLQKLGLRLLEESKFEIDPHSQLLSIYGASIAKNQKLLPILERGLSSESPQVQLASIRALAEYHDDQADRILLKGLRSNYLEVCFETTFMLAVNKHPEAIGYIEALMNKVPPQLHFLFPSLYAILDTPQSAKSLRKFFQHKDPSVRVEAILSSAKLNRQDLIGDLRSLSRQDDLTQLEAAAFTLGILQDEGSFETLERLVKNPSEHVALSALCALYMLGRTEVVTDIERYAAQGNIFAIHLLRNCQCDEKILEALVYHENEQVRLNAALALLKKKNPLCLQEIRNLLMPKDPQRILLPVHSPGRALLAKSWALKSASASRGNPYLIEFSNQIRQEVLNECMELTESLFLTLASEIIDAHQHDLIPQVISLVQSLKTSHSIELLKEWQKKPGHPYLRAWSNLALFNLDQEGPWKENIIQWIKLQSTHPMIQLKPVVPWNKKSCSHFELTPEESSQLLIESYLALALRQEEDGIEIIISHLANLNSKNKYALAGILIKATE